jgi:predicted alpha/beta hydrolase
MTTGKIVAADGFALAASGFTPPEATPVIATAVIAPATGVPRRFYHAFAAFLAEGGIATTTFDYRGIGESRPPSLKGFQAQMHDWGELDISAALAFSAAAAPALPRLFVGHSVGGQILGLAAGKENLSGALFVASQSGYWRHWPGYQKALFAALWWAAIPAVTGMAGFLPMLGGGENLPKGVAREWARWGRHPDYILSYPGIEASRYREFAGPILACCIEGDSYAPRRAVEALLTGYPNAKPEVRMLSGEGGVGHFGFFRARNRERLWTPARAWLLERCQPPAAAANPAPGTIRSATNPIT